jgi:hypothetical protein
MALQKPIPFTNRYDGSLKLQNIEVKWCGRNCSNEIYQLFFSSHEQAVSILNNRVRLRRPIVGKGTFFPFIPTGYFRFSCPVVTLIYADTQYYRLPPPPDDADSDTGCDVIKTKLSVSLKYVMYVESARL